MKNKIVIMIITLFLIFVITGCNFSSSNKKITKKEGTTTVTKDNERIIDDRNLTPEEYTFLNLVGTDEFGRKILEKDNYYDGERYVGIWYSLWLGQHQYMQQAVYDNTELLKTKEGTEHLNTNESYEDSRMGEFHFCAKPLYGYYNMLDPWVVTRHVELLTMAGIDYLSFDTTNAVIYPEVVVLVLDTLLKYQNQGFKVPKVMFYVNSNAGSTAKKIYNNFYQTEKYDDIWFSPNGKPLLAGVTENSNGASDQTMFSNGEPIVEDYMFNRFEIVESQWPQGFIEHENSIPWMSWKYPQSIHQNYEAISVSVAQHDPTYINFSHQGEWSSRGFDHTTNKVYENYEKGQNFESEWKSVFSYLDQGKNVKNVLVCGFNEWMAIKGWNGSETTFCDVYTDEYSRDIEMMDGSCKDNFYLQLIRNLKEYKCTEAKSYKYDLMTIDIDDNELSQWENVKAHYRDFSGDAMERNYSDATNTGMYTDYSNRNDITDIKVIHNKKYLYFYIKCNNKITAYNGTDKNWMNLLINTNKGNQSFEGFDYVVNRSPKNDTTSLEKSIGGYNFEYKEEIEYRLYDDVIIFKIPLESLGLTKDNCYITFKVTDNITNPDDIMNYYVSGDSVPIGRLSYSYGK